MWISTAVPDYLLCNPAGHHDMHLSCWMHKGICSGVFGVSGALRLKHLKSRQSWSVLSTVGPEYHLQTQQVVCKQHMLLSSAAVLRPSVRFSHIFSHSPATVSAILPPQFQLFFCPCFSHSSATISAICCFPHPDKHQHTYIQNCSVLFKHTDQRNMLSTVSAYHSEAHILLC